MEPIELAIIAGGSVALYCAVYGVLRLKSREYELARGEDELRHEQEMQDFLTSLLEGVPTEAGPPTGAGGPAGDPPTAAAAATGDVAPPSAQDIVRAKIVRKLAEGGRKFRLRKG